MDYLIDFPALPSVVQDLIVHKIVHHSIPDDRIRFAQTAKFCNDLVKRAKPKKIVKELLIEVDNQTEFYFDESNCIDSMEELRRISSNCQIECLELSALFKIENDELFPMLDHISSQSIEFTTELIFHYDMVKSEELIEFFKKFKHLERLDVANNVWMLDHLSYLPPQLCFRFLKEKETYDWLKILAKKSTQHPISSLDITGIIPLNLMHEFLREVNFTKYGEIFFRCNAMNNVNCFINMVVLDSNLYEVGVFPYSKPFVIVEQEIGKDNKRNLCIWHDLKNDAPIPFTVVTSSSPTTPIFSSELTNANDVFTKIDFTLENIDKNDWVKFNFEGDLRVHYYDQMITDGFPRNEYKNSQERIEKINEVLGTKISIINFEMLNEMIQAAC